MSMWTDLDSVFQAGSFALTGTEVSLRIAAADLRIESSFDDYVTKFSRTISEMKTRPEVPDLIYYFVCNLPEGFAQKVIRHPTG